MSSEISNAHKFFNSDDFFIEKFVDFKMEISVIVARGVDNSIMMYPITENIHEENILIMSIVPARISIYVTQKIKEIAKNVLNNLTGAGVFCIEMFLTKNDDVLINEIAPRVHNSGHHTLQSCVTSQFEQHMRAILGLKLGSTKLLHNTIMYNILGPKNFYGEFKSPEFGNMDHDLFIKMYNKTESKPLRKLGHINIVDTMNTNNINYLLRKADFIKHLKLVKPYK